MRTVYAVASGEYSDYRVHCVFEREADAEAHAQRRSASAYETAGVEPMVLYESGEAPEPVDHCHYEVLVREDGTLANERQWSYTSWSYEGDAPPKRPTVRLHGRRVIGRASNPAAARKAVLDRAAKMQAEATEASPR